MAIQQFTAGQTLTANAMNTLQASDYNYTRKVITTSSYTTVLEDRGQLLEFQNAGGTTVTIPLNSSVAYTVGDVLEIVNGSTATITIVGDTGVTIEATGDITSLTSEWQKCQLVKRETNNWLLTGITSVAILDSVITDADVSPSAAIAKTKIAGTAITAADTGTITSAMIADGTIVNADINASAAIDKTKISGTAITAADTGTVTSSMIADGAIVNADINASAAIALSKLATGSSGQLIVHNSSGVPTATTATGDVTIDSSGVTAIASGVIVNADINNSASIAYSKLNLSNSVTATDLASGAPRAGFRSSQNQQTGTTYTLALSDVGGLVELSNTSSITVTIPLDSSVAFAVGDRIDILQTNTGQVTVAGAGGVTLNAYDNQYKLNGRWAAGTLIKRAADTWVLIGNITS